MPRNKRQIATAWIAGKKRFFYGATKEEAEAKRDAGKAKSKNPQPAPIQTLSDPSTFAFFVYNTFAARKAEGISPTYKARVNSLLKWHILPALGHLPIARIGYEEMEKFKRGLAIQRKGLDRPLSPKSKREALILAREILALYGSLARARGFAARDDWKLVKLPKQPRKKEREEPEADFETKLMDVARGSWLEGPLVVALFLGLRRGEVCGLKWSAIDRKAMRLKIKEQRHPLLPAGSLPKMNKTRTLPLPEKVLQKIDEIGDRGSVYLFTMPDHKPLRPNAITDAMGPLCTKAGVKTVTFHDLRSFAASNLIGIGADVFAVMEILGHNKIDTTTLYVNQKEKVKRNALDLLCKSDEPGSQASV